MIPDGVINTIASSPLNDNGLGNENEVSATDKKVAESAPASQPTHTSSAPTLWLVPAGKVYEREELMLVAPLSNMPIV